MAQQIQAIRGMNDLLPADIGAWQHLEACTRELLTSYAYDNVADWIGAGLDPERSTFFVQSLVPEHA